MLKTKWCSHCFRPHLIQYFYGPSGFDCCMKLYKVEYDQMKKRHPRYPCFAAPSTTPREE